MQYFEASKSS